MGCPTSRRFCEKWEPDVIRVEERAFRAYPERSRRARVNDLYQSQALAPVDTGPKGHLLAGLRRGAKAPLFHGTAIRPNKHTVIPSEDDRRCRDDRRSRGTLGLIL